MTRQQLPPQIKKVEVKDRRTGKAETRYELFTTVGDDPTTGKRRHVRRRFKRSGKPAMRSRRCCRLPG